MQAVGFDERAGGDGLGASASKPRLRAVVVDAVLPEWDEFVKRSGGDIVQTTMWASSKSSAGHLTILVEARDRRDIVAGALLVTRRIGAGPRLGYIARGPVLGANGLPLLGLVVDTAMEAARAHGVVGLIVQPAMVGQEATLDSKGFREGAPPVAPDATVVIDVTKSDDEIIAAMSGWRRKDLRRARKEPIEIVESDDLRLFHKLHAQSAARGGYEPLSLDYLESQWRALAPSGAVTLLIAKCEGRPAAGEWLTNFGSVVTTRMTGWDRDASGKLHVNVALQWAAIQHARRIGASVYDFGGFDRETAELLLEGRTVPDAFKKTPNYFKLDFGAAPVLLSRCRFIILNQTANRLLGGIASSLLRSRPVERLAKRLRNS
jgi:lipid II:glycine glycyltransferase (peptidoglycan interpeptide bridge formation enzyme)